MESHMPEWVKTLIIALVTSFFTVCLIEPIRAAISRWIRKRELRRSLYHEMVLNFRALDLQVGLATRDAEMIAGIGYRFGESFKKSCFDFAQRVPLIYYTLRAEERYWIELLYSGWQQVADGHFDNDAQRLRNADFNAGYLLTCVKNRHLSRKLIFKVCPIHLRECIRERLPDVACVDIEAPKFLERLRRKVAD